MIVTVVACKGCSDRVDATIGWMSDGSNRSSFTPLAITLRYHYMLCAFVCKIKYYDAQIKDSLLYKYSRGFDLLAYLREYATKCLQENKTRKQLAFLIISSA